MSFCESKKRKKRPKRTKKASLHEALRGEKSVSFYWMNSVQDTVGQNQVVLRHRIIHFPMSLGVSEWTCEQTSERNKARE